MSGLENDKDVPTAPSVPPESPHIFKIVVRWLAAVAAILTVLVTIVNQGNRLVDGLQKIFASATKLRDVPPKPSFDSPARAASNSPGSATATPLSTTVSTPNTQAKWAQVAVYGPTVKITSGGATGGNPGCTGRTVQSCARPEHGGRLLPSSGTLVDVSSNGRVGSSVITDSPEQICIQLWASTSACETQVSIEGRTKAIEEFASELKIPEDTTDSATPIPNANVKPAFEKATEASSGLEPILGRWVIAEGNAIGEPVQFSRNFLGFDAWLSWAGQASLQTSDGLAGSNLKIQSQNLKCYYYVTFISSKEMIWALRDGDHGCPQSTRFSKVPP